jgi:hypothetical protein
MSEFFDKENEQHKTLTESRFFLGVMVDPEVDSYFLMQSKIFNSTKSEEVRKELKKVYEAGVSNTIRNMVRKTLISIENPASIDRDSICKELKKQGVYKDHIKQITELVWKELENQNH